MLIKSSYVLFLLRWIDASGIETHYKVLGLLSYSMFVNLTNFLENSSGVLGALEIHTDPHLVHTITCFQRVCVCVCEWRQPRTLWWRAACWEHHLCEGVNLFTSRKQISNLLFCSPFDIFCEKTHHPTFTCDGSVNCTVHLLSHGEEIFVWALMHSEI